MNSVTALHLHALQRFEPNSEAVYTIDSAAHLAGMPRHQILVCCKHGLVSPLIDETYGAYLFDTEAIRTLQRIRYLRHECGINLPGIQMILQLLNEVERLRTAARYTDYF